MEIEKISTAFTCALHEVRCLASDHPLLQKNFSRELLNSALNDAQESFFASMTSQIDSLFNRLLRIAGDCDKDRQRKYQIDDGRKHLCHHAMEQIAALVKGKFAGELDEAKKRHDENQLYEMIPVTQAEVEVEEDETGQGCQVAKDNSVFVLNIKADSSSPIHTVVSKISEPDYKLTQEQLDKYLQSPLTSKMHQFNIEPAGVKISALDKNSSEINRLCAVVYLLQPAPAQGQNQLNPPVPAGI